MSNPVEVTVDLSVNDSQSSFISVVRGKEVLLVAGEGDEVYPVLLMLEQQLAKAADTLRAQEERIAALERIRDAAMAFSNGMRADTVEIGSVGTMHANLIEAFNAESDPPQGAAQPVDDEKCWACNGTGMTGDGDMPCGVCSWPAAQPPAPDNEIRGILYGWARDYGIRQDLVNALIYRLKGTQSAVKRGGYEEQPDGSVHFEESTPQPVDNEPTEAQIKEDWERLRPTLGQQVSPFSAYWQGRRHPVAPVPTDEQIESIGKAAISYAMSKPPCTLVEACRAALQGGEHANSSRDN